MSQNPDGDSMSPKQRALGRLAVRQCEAVAETLRRILMAPDDPSDCAAAQDAAANVRGSGDLPLSQVEILDLCEMLARARRHLESMATVRESMNEKLDDLIACEGIDARISEMANGPEAIAGFRMRTGQHVLIDRVISIALISLQWSLLLRMSLKNIQGLQERIVRAQVTRPG